MKVRFLPQSKIQNLKSKILDYGRLVRFSHTVFALPFALASLALAWPAHPVTFRSFLWILVAMVSARTAAMAFNRIVDRKFDALNPRTREWDLPQGKITVEGAVILTIACSFIFVFAAFQLNFVCFVLSPVALGIVFFYSLTKRFTWTSHLFLGLALSLAPLGAWLAVAQWPLNFQDLIIPALLGLAVLFWLAGFDVIYSLQDRDFDRSHGLFSIPARFSIAGALQLSSGFHLATVVLLALVGIAAQSGVIYWIGFFIISLVLFWEHRILRPDDLSRINRAFFEFNAYVSIGYFLTTAGDVLLSGNF